jgi:DNA-binding CsgD family transcriptional regulator
LLKREWRLLELVSQGLKNREIAEKFSTTPHVIKNQLRVVYDKTGVFNRVELALWYEARRHFGEIPTLPELNPASAQARRPARAVVPVPRLPAIQAK